MTRFTPDAKCVVSGGDDGIVRLWDIGTGDKEHTDQKLCSYLSFTLAGHFSRVHR